MTTLSFYTSFVSGVPTLLLFFASAILFVFVSVPIHEAGHLVCGRLSGYHFLSFRLFMVEWVKTPEGTQRRRAVGRAVAGQCMMAPPPYAGFRYRLYNLGGSLFNALATLPALGFAIPFRHTLAAPVLFAFAAVNLYMALGNAIPLVLGIPNDGMNGLKARAGEGARYGFYLMLQNNAETMAGRRYQDFDPALFRLDPAWDKTNYFVAYIAMCEATRLYDLGFYRESVEIYSTLPIDTLPTYYRGAIWADILYYSLVHEPNLEQARQIYARPEMTYFFKSGALGSHRVACAYEFFVNRNPAAAQAQLQKAKQQLQNLPNPGARLMETDILQKLEGQMLSASQTA